MAWEYDEIFNNLCDKVERKTWSKDEFYKFVGNVANIQTRVWRRYFNFTNYKALNFNKDKMKIYDDSKLAKHILRNFRDFRYTKEYEKKIFNEIKAIMQGLNEALKNKKDEKSFLALEFLKNTDPILTIPPYESRINKNPQICNAMSINQEKITQNLKNITKKIFTKDDFKFLLIDENGEIKTPDFNDIKISAKYLQRFLDISKSRLNDSGLYPRNLDKNFQNFKGFFALNDDEMKEFLKFTNDYYDEVDSAKKGVIKGEILKICGLHTPHKHKNKKELISALFIKNHRQILDYEFNDLCELMQNSGEYKGEYKGARNRKIAKFFEDLDENRKTYKNAFFNEILDIFNSLKENGDKNLDANLVKIVRDYEIIAKTIQEKIKFCEFKTPFDSSNLATNINYLLQLGDIIFNDKNAGFLKTCKEHTMENLLRCGGEAMASRLPSNAGRLINGKIEMYLDYLAYEIIKKCPNFNDFNEIEINVEMNKFVFEEGAIAINLKTKPKKEKKEKSFICPYSGDNISESNCEYDHIIARKDKNFNTIFNSAANLIPCKSSANLKKSNKVYKLEDLNAKHLESVFGTSDIKAIKNYITENLATIDEKKYTNFYNLSKKEQNAFRYALFLREGKDFKKAISLLNQDKIKGYSNGTQKRFVNLAIEKIKKLSKEQLNFSVNFIDSKMLSATRAELSTEHNEIKKQNTQDSHSHCIDASVAFYLANSKLIKNNYFDEIYPKESEIISPKGKKYLELKTNIARKPLFDDSVYSLVYEQCDNGKFISIKNLKILRDLGLLYTRKNGKKIQVPAGQAIDENAIKKYFVSTHKVFDKIFEYFKNKDIDGLKELKFLDNYLKSYKREDITKIFGIGNDNKLIIKKEKDATPNVAKFYEILKKHEDKISHKHKNEKGEVVYKIDENAIKALYKQTFDKGQKRKRNKTRCVYSLSMIADSSECVVRRNGGYMGLKQASIAAKNYLFKNKKGELDIKGVPFYSKNVLPKKIADILMILELPEDAKPLYGEDKKYVFDNTDLKNLLPNINKEIADLVIEHVDKVEFKFTEKSRHMVRIYLIKSSLLNINFSIIDEKPRISKNEEFAKLLNETGVFFKDIFDKPRNDKTIKIKDLKYVDFKILNWVKETFKNKKNNDCVNEFKDIKCIQNDNNIIAFEYTAETSANFKALIKEILNETPSAK